MRKPLIHGLFLTCLLTGCELPAVVVKAPVLEVEQVIGSNNVGIAAISKPLPSPRLAVTPRPSLGGRQNPLARTADAGASADSASGTAESATRTPHLKLAAGSETGLKLVPIKNDEGAITSMMAQPASGEVTWRLQAVNGPLSVAKVKVSYQSQAAYPAPAAPDAEGAVAPPTVPPMIDPVSEKGEVLSFEHPAAALDLPESWKSGAQATLTLSLISQDTVKFFEANPRTARAAITLTPLDATGKPLPGPDGQPIVIQSTIAVL